MGSEVPNGWSREPLASLGSFHKGRGGPKKDGEETGIPVVRYGELYTQHNDVIRDFHSYISEAKAKDYTRLRIGDVLFAGSGETLGEIGKSAVFLGPDPAHGSGDIIIFRPDACVDPLFAGYASNSVDAVEQKKHMGQGSSVMHIYTHNLEKLELPIPPLPEQKKIAAILSSVDEAIQTTQAVIEQTRRLKEGLLQDLLTKGIGHTRFQQTEIGEIPEEWEVACVESLAHIATGAKDTKDKVHCGRYPFFVRSQIVENIDSYSFDGEAVLTAGDGVGTGKVFHYINGRFDYHQRVYCISDFVVRMRGKFFFYYFQTHFIEQVRRYSAKNSVDSVRRAMISRMGVPVPSVTEQDTIISILSSADVLIESEEMKLSALDDVKAGLLQDLLTGKVRVAA